MGYRGRHRKPSTGGKTAARIATAVGVGAVGFAGVPALGDAPQASAGILDAIERCESGGNAQAQNPRSSASGAFQFLDSTWRSVTGLRGSASDYSYGTQRAAAQKLLASQGTTPWNPSRSCWAGQGGVSAARKAPARKAAPRHESRTSPRHAARSATAPRHSALGVRGPDGRGVYRCSPATLFFEACDPNNLGELVRVPRYDR